VMDPVRLLFDAAILVLAGLVRGFSGFGFAMVAVTGLSMIHPPAEVVPAVLCLEIAASVHLLPRVWQHVHWRSIAWLTLGMLAGTLPGAWLLATASPTAMRVWVSLAVLAGAVVLVQERRWTALMSKPAGVVAGVCSGVLNASASIGGPPVILYYLASPIAVEVARASLIAFFVVADLFSLAAMAGFGLLTAEVLVAAVLWLVPAVVGVSLGNRLFHALGARHYRTAVVWLLAVLAAGGLGRAAWDHYCTPSLPRPATPPDVKSQSTPPAFPGGAPDRQTARHYSLPV